MPTSSGRTVGACRQCHGRKVRCDRDPSGCAACRRFDIKCSIVHYDTRDLDPAQGESFQDGSRAQSGLKRRRTQTACRQCHRLKTRCSGDLPCTRCLSNKQSCSYDSEDVGSSGPRSASTGMANYGELPLETPFDLGDLGNRDDLRRYLEAYFEQDDSAGRVFLHKASVMADFHEDRIDALLLLALCALGMRQSLAAKNIEHADRAMDNIERAISTDIANITLSRLQALTLLLHYRRMSAKRNELWMLLSVAARMAFTLCLNHEHHNLATVRQESNRRLMWSLFLLDTLGCAGLDALVVCPAAHLHIRLPCDEHSFALGLPSSAAGLNQPQMNSASEEVSAKILRLMLIRHQVLGYSRRVILSGRSPWETRNELEDIRNQLLQAQSTLPQELQPTRQNLLFRATTPSFASFVMLHAHWHQIFCDLYRFLVPGRRESVSTPAFNATPPAYAVHCQQQCHRWAQAAIEFFVQVHDLPARKAVGDSFFGVIAYHVASVASTLSSHTQSPGELLALRDQLRKILSLVQESAGCNVILENCGADIKAIISALPESPRSEPDAANGATMDNSDYVFVSKHSTLPSMQEMSARSSQDPLLNDPAAVDHEASSQPALPYRYSTSNDIPIVNPGEETVPLSPIWQDDTDLSFADGGIYGLYDFAQDSSYHVEPFDMRLDRR